jgi:dihydrofolate reductase
VTSLRLGVNIAEEHKQFFSKTPHIRRIVMTNRAFDTRAPQGVEFSTLSPKRLVQSLEKQGRTKALLAGGPRLSATFFKSKLVSEFFLTIEPKVFGAGLPLLDGIIGTQELRLVSIKKLNRAGTLLLRYKIHV